MNDNDGIKIIPIEDFKDKEKCHSIRFEVFVKEQNCSPEGEIDEYDTKQNCHYLLALKNSIPIGTVRIHSYDDDKSLTSSSKSSFSSSSLVKRKCKIGRLSVIKQHRSQGIGTRLLEEVEKFGYNELKIENFILHAQFDKKDWYEKRGYKISSKYGHDNNYNDEIFYEENIPHVRMEKQFTDI